MTLIAGAISKDGVVIRSDKRQTKKTSAGGITHCDDLDKVYVSADKKTIIYNHGINEINGKPWRTLASDIDTTLAASPPTDALSALDAAESTIGDDASAEIAGNTIDEMTAFVIIFKDTNDKWHAGDISWHRREDLKKEELGRFFWSGEGAKNYFRPTAEQKTDQHWASLTAAEALSEIEKLYKDAVIAQEKAKGAEFSPCCQDLTVT